MNYKLKDVISSIDYYELKKIQNDLNGGGFHLKKFISAELLLREKKHEKICASCHVDIDDITSKNYTLLFGPKDMLKKASFCGRDCLSHFLNQVEQKSRY